MSWASGSTTPCVHELKHKVTLSYLTLEWRDFQELKLIYSKHQKAQKKKNKLKNKKKKKTKKEQETGFARISHQHWFIQQTFTASLRLASWFTKAGYTIRK